MLRCPISNTLMKEPVMAADGFTYDRTAITNWIELNCTSPTTGAPITPRLYPNKEKKIQIEQWIAAHDLSKEDQLIDCCFSNIAWANSSGQVCNQLLTLATLVTQTQTLPAKQQLRRMRIHLSGDELIWCPQVAQLLDNLDDHCQTLAETLNSKLKVAQMAVRQAHATTKALEDALAEQQHTVRAALERVQMLSAKENTNMVEADSAAEPDISEPNLISVGKYIDIEQPHGQLGLPPVSGEAFEGWVDDGSGGREGSQRPLRGSPESIAELSIPPQTDIIPEPSIIRLRESIGEPSTPPQSDPASPRLIGIPATESAYVEAILQPRAVEPPEISYRQAATQCKSPEGTQYEISASSNKRSASECLDKTVASKHANRRHGNLLQQQEQQQRGDPPTQSAARVVYAILLPQELNLRDSINQILSPDPAVAPSISEQSMQFGSSKFAVSPVQSPYKNDAPSKDQPGTTGPVVQSPIAECSTPLGSLTSRVRQETTLQQQPDSTEVEAKLSNHEAMLKLASCKPLSRAANFASRLGNLLTRAKEQGARAFTHRQFIPVGKGGRLITM